VSTFAYDELSQVVAIKCANGIAASLSYDNANRLLRLSNVTTGGTTVSSFRYRYDNVGNKTSVAELGGGRVSWTYDSLYRLESERRSGAAAFAATYIYDAMGNAILKLDGANRTTQTFNRANQLASVLLNTTRTTFTYDMAGNVTLRKDQLNNRTTYTWDGESRLIRFVAANAGIYTYSYDADGRRVAIAQPGAVQLSVWDMENVFLDTDAFGSIQTEYTSSPQLYGCSVSRASGGNSVFYQFDGTGSTSSLTGSGGTVLGTFTYDAYGNIISGSGASDKLLYQGRVMYFWDNSTSLFYVRNRYYDPSIACFLSRDPVTAYSTWAFFGSMYNYVNNNPVNRNDPNGRQLGMIQKYWTCPTPIGLGSYIPPQCTLNLPLVQLPCPAEDRGCVVCFSCGALIGVTGGEPFYCPIVYNLPFSGNPPQGVIACTCVHEATHGMPQIARRSCSSNNGVGRLIAATPWDRDSSECNSFEAELQCLSNINFQNIPRSQQADFVSWVNYRMFRNKCVYHCPFDAERFWNDNFSTGTGRSWPQWLDALQIRHPINCGGAVK
jgi:RHS repeat-associated protein